MLVHMPIDSPPRAWAEVSLSAIKHNLSVLSNKSGNARMMPVIKAGAYGHGLETVARSLDNEGIAFFGVANVGEARRLNICGCHTKPYILGPCFPEEREEIVSRNWRGFISTFEEADHYQSLAGLYGKTLPVHVSVDVGMGRGGFLPGQLGEMMDRTGGWKNLRIEGMAAHLPSADEDKATTAKQIETFRDAVETFENRQRLDFKHIAASAGILDYQIPFANMARPGLSLYGYSPVSCDAADELKPALTMKSRITVVRTLPSGHGVSYGSTFMTSGATKVATVGVGYADGYFRALSGKNARVFYKDRYVSVLGRVTMDQIMIDVSGIDDARSGAIVEVFGPRVTVPELASLAGTIPWEILTAIGPRIPRIYV